TWFSLTQARKVDYALQIPIKQLQGDLSMAKIRTSGGNLNENDLVCLTALPWLCSNLLKWPADHYMGCLERWTHGHTL
ncbi:unnamed protein product, partial [Candidula unifasciata]